MPDLRFKSWGAPYTWVCLILVWLRYYSAFVLSQPFVVCSDSTLQNFITATFCFQYSFILWPARQTTAVPGKKGHRQYNPVERHRPNQVSQSKCSCAQIHDPLKKETLKAGDWGTTTCPKSWWFKCCSSCLSPASSLGHEIRHDH